MKPSPKINRTQRKLAALTVGLALGLFASTAYARGVSSSIAISTADVQAALDALYPGQGWVAANCQDPGGSAKLICGRYNGTTLSSTGTSILTMPSGTSGANTPATLTRKVLITGVSPTLHLKVRSFTYGKTAGDWVLKVFVNDTQLKEASSAKTDVVVKSTTAVDYRFSLEAYVGKEVTIQLQNAAGGENGWAWENALWDLIEIVTEDPPVRATWTSAADDGNPQNPENWACTNANGAAVASALPEDVTVVTIPDGCTNSFPVGKGFRAKEVKLPATLGADNLDWSGITAPLSGTLDLRGKKLTVSQLMGTATITDSTNLSGELHVNVTEGTKVNTTVALTGSLKFVKEGAGTFTAAKTGQTYAGGTEVAAGKFLFSSTADEKTNCYAGKAGSTVTVDAGATLDLYGNAGFNTHPLVLAGGTVMSSGTSNYLVESAQIGDVTLTANSTINPSQHIRCTGCIDLGTHMITITPPNGKYFSMWDGSSFKNGLVNVTAVGYIHFMDGAVRDLRTVDFLLNCGTDFTGEITVRDLEFVWTGGAKNAGIISVTRTYMPRLTTGSTRKCELRDGATLDLRYQTAAWLLEPTHLTFEKDATVTVSFGDSPVRNGQIVSWATGNDPGNSVTFVKDPTLDGHLFREATGLFYRAAFRILVR